MIMSLSNTFDVCGSTKTQAVITANGTAMTFIKGMRLPPLKLLRSDQPAIIGSVTASNILPTMVISPNSVMLVMFLPNTPACESV